MAWHGLPAKLKRELTVSKIQTERRCEGVRKTRKTRKGDLPPLPDPSVITIDLQRDPGETPHKSPP